MAEDCQRILPANITAHRGRCMIVFTRSACGSLGGTGICRVTVIRIGASVVRTIPAADGFTTWQGILDPSATPRVHPECYVIKMVHSTGDLLQPRQTNVGAVPGPRVPVPSDLSTIHRPPDGYLGLRAKQGDKVYRQKIKCLRILNKLVITVSSPSALHVAVAAIVLGNTSCSITRKGTKNKPHA